MSETREQQAAIQWARMQRDRRLHTLLIAIPNGGNRNVWTAQRLKAEGVVAGIPDLFLAIAAFGFNGLFIEMKFGRNKPTKEQRARMDELMAEGYLCVVCYSADEAIAWIRGYLDERFRAVHTHDSYSVGKIMAAPTKQKIKLLLPIVGHEFSPYHETDRQKFIEKQMKFFGITEAA